MTSSPELRSFVTELEATDEFKKIFHRFIVNHDDITITREQLKDDKGGDDNDAFGYSPDRVPGKGYLIQINVPYIRDGKIAMDPSFLAKVILHEGVHQKWALAIAQDGIDKYPGLKANQAKHDAGVMEMGKIIEADHKTMAQAMVPDFVHGMEQFDAQAGKTHSKDWYDAMAWWGSLSRATIEYKHLDKDLRKNYKKIMDMEDAYQAYLQLKYRYEHKPDAKLKERLDKAEKKVDKDLFKQTRPGINVDEVFKL
jgi:hypothetical protein